MMTYDEIDEKRQQLVDIMKINPPSARMQRLEDLASAVGASSIRIETHPGIMIAQNAISETEIVQNIHAALQTATTLAMCHTASRSYIITIIAALVAFVSAMAAWTSVILNYCL